MIRFFISSTFKDMQVERDTIHRIIYPQIRDYGLERGISVDICDLRWGIDYNKSWSEEESINEIMKVCFKEVQDCKPHIVAIIGEKYGSRAPNEQSVIEIWKSIDREKMLPSKTDISLTQWELEFSFLAEVNPDTKALCLFRRGNRRRREEEVEDLEFKIKEKREKLGNKIVCRDYSEQLGFESAFIEYAKSVIDEETKDEERINWVEKELRYAQACSVDKCKGFAGRSRYLSEFKEFVEDGAQNVMVLYGQSGIGKSSLMAKMYQITQEKGIYSEIIFSGLSQSSSYYLNVLIEIIYILDRKINGDACKVRDSILTEEEAERIIESLLTKWNENNSEQLCIFVDAMNKLSVIGKNRIVDIFASTHNSKVKLICSQIVECETNRRMKVIIREVLPLSKREIAEILTNNLYDSNQNRVKTETPVVKALMKKRCVSSPLYIKTAINILKMHISGATSIQDKDVFFGGLIDEMPEETTEVCWYAFQEAFKFIIKDSKVKARNRERDLELVVGVMAAARYGLREKDLEGILSRFNWKSVEFATLRLFLRDFFRYMQDGCWTFEHDLITRGVLNHFDKEGVVELRKMIYKYLKSPNMSDTEALVKEGFFLSFYFADIEFATHIFEVLCTFPILQIRTIASKELETVIQDEMAIDFFAKVAQANVCAITGAVASLLEYVGSNDYPRRIPARNIADALWDALAIKTREDINKWNMKSGRSFEEKHNMAMLCAEYVSVYDDSGDHIRAIAYSFFPKDFYESEVDFKRLSFEQQRRAYRQMNALFNANNSVLSNISGLSMEIMDWFAVAPKKLPIIERRTRNAFDGNIGQYYSATGNLNLSVKRRFAKMINNIDMFFDSLPKDFAEYKKQFSHLYRVLKRKNVTILDVDFVEHRLFWKNVADVVSANISNGTFKKSVAERLDSVGRSYFVICYDIIKTGRDTQGYKELVEKGCESIEIAIDIFSNESVHNKRELLSSYIRRLQVNERKLFISREELETIMVWGMKTIDDYLDGYDDYGFDLGFLLWRSIEKYDRHIKNNFDEKKTGEYYERVGQLYKKLYDE